MGFDDLGRLSDLAAAQDGLFSVEQADALGIDRGRLRRAGAAGILTRDHPNVWRFRAAPRTRRQRVRGAVLQVGPAAVASHESALVLHGLDRIEFTLAVTVPPGVNHRHEDIRVHRFGDLVDDHVTLVDGIPTTTLARAVVDVASVFSTPRLADLVDRLTITHRSLTVADVGRVLRVVNRRGRRHVARLGRLLDERGPSEPAPRSRVEREVDRLLAMSGLPTPVPEYPLPDEIPGAQFVDRAWPEAKLILEVDGRPWHARERSMAKDRARDRAASRLGWLTLRVLDEEVVQLPDVVLDDVVATYHHRRHQLGTGLGA